MFKEPINCVTVCVGYGDFLTQTLKWNRHHFDKYVVVTEPQDEETRLVCRKYGVTCLTTDDKTRDGEFSKGRLVERGLMQLPAEGWSCHLDADIVLPLNFRTGLERAHLQDDCIYGADRFMVRGYDKWKALIDSDWLTGKDYGHPHVCVPPKGFEIGARWVGFDGYVSVGYLQLWHRVGGEEEWKGIRTKSYPNLHGNACRGDVQFSHLFDRRKRVLLPEFYVAHLESQECSNGANWKGRKTKRFGPELKVNISKGTS